MGTCQLLFSASCSLTLDDPMGSSLGICEQNFLYHHKPPLKMCWSPDVKCSLQGSSWAYKGAGLHQVVSSLQMRLHSVESRFSRLTSLKLLPVSKFHEHFHSTDREHWKLPVSLLGVVLQAQVDVSSISLSTCFSVLGVYEHLPLGTINEVAAESVCELSIHVHFKGGHLSAHWVISPEKKWHLGFSSFIQWNKWVNWTS